MITNCYGQFTDTPVDEAWFLKFKCLWLPTDHRKILNCQPIFNGLDFTFNFITGISSLPKPHIPKNGTMIYFKDWVLDVKIMSN